MNLFRMALEEEQVEEDSGVDTTVSEDKTVIPSDTVESDGNDSEVLVNDTIEENVAELKDIEAATAEHKQQVEDAEEVVESLEAYCDILQSSLDTDVGGLNKVSADILNVSLKRLYNVVGINNQKATAALESITDNNNFSYTQETLSDIGNQITKIAKAIVVKVKEFLEKIMAWLKSVWDKLFSRNEAIKKENKILKDKLRSKIANESIAVERYEPVSALSPDLLDAVGINGSIPSVSSVQFKQFENLIPDSIRAGRDIMDLTYSNFNVTNNIKSLFKRPTIKDVGDTNPFMNTLKTDTYLGNLYICFQLPTDNNSTIEKAKQYKNHSKIIFVKEETKHNTLTVSKSPSIEECLEITRFIDNISKNVDECDGQLKRYSDFKDNILKDMESVIDAAANKDDIRLLASKRDMYVKNFTLTTQLLSRATHHSQLVCCRLHRLIKITAL